MRQHRDHRPGTVDECPDCARAAYEPGWYATMLSIDTGGDSTLLLDVDLDQERGEAPVT